MDLAAPPYNLGGADDSTADDDTNADAALAALRAAIGAGRTDGVLSDDDDDDDAIDPVLDQALEGYGAAQASRSVGAAGTSDAGALHSQSQSAEGALDKTNAISLLNHLQQANTALINSMNLSTVLEGLLASVKTLTENQQKQGDIIRALIAAQVEKRQPTSAPDPQSALDQLTAGWVPQATHDTLQAKYDDLVKSTAADRKPGDGRKRRGKGPNAVATLAQTPTPSVVAVEVEGEEPEEKVGRKKRSVRLEKPAGLVLGQRAKVQHIIHQHLNRLIGLEYTVSGFEMPGSSFLLPPCPPSEVPGPDTSMNGIQEFRPDYTKSNEDAEIRVLLDQVVDEVWTRWTRGDSQGEQGVDRDKIVLNVNTYWNRLMKRWQEQQARQRGETHRDEITRRKQNRYRRQQSLVVRRVAAFDASPLNACNQRALFRTLLTIEFAAATNERPDIDDITASASSAASINTSTAASTSRYTAAEWYAYRQSQLPTRPEEGHESVDIHWLSPAARSALLLLDAYSNHASESSKRKGRPKAPSPTFHLPRSMWDKSKLPILRPKDEQGLPVHGAPGVVLFEWHVDEGVKRENEEWARGLYETPPLSGIKPTGEGGEGGDVPTGDGEADAALPTLEEVLMAPRYDPIKEYKRREEKLLDVRELTPAEVAALSGMSAVGAGGSATGRSQTRAGASLDMLDPMVDDQFGDSANSTPGQVGGDTAAGDVFAPMPHGEGEGDGETETDYYNMSHAQAVAAALVDQQRRQQQQQQQQHQSQSQHQAIRPTLGSTKSDQGPSAPGLGSPALVSGGGSPAAPAVPVITAAPAVSVVTATSATTSATVSPSALASSAHLATRGPGTSIRARKQSKRSMSAVPVGAATPVAKRPRPGPAGIFSPASNGISTTAAVQTSSVGTLAGIPADVQKTGSGGQGMVQGRGNTIPPFNGQQVYGVQQPLTPQPQPQPRHTGVGVGVGIGVGVGLGMGRSLSGSHLGSSSSGL